MGNINPSDYNADANNLVVGSLSGNNGITILSSSGSGYGSLYFADGTSVTQNKSGYIRYQQNQSNMTFGINAVEKMRINLAGNVGIGVTNPIKALEIAMDANSGDLRIRPQDGAYQDYYLDIAAQAASVGAVRMSIKDNTFLKTYGYYNLTGLSLGVAANEDLIYLDNSEKVGIGTITPKAKLDVAGGIRMADDTSTATSTNVGTMRYRDDSNTSYVDMCMRTSSGYEWVNIVQNNYGA
jgi:hypothetical protein